MTKPQWYLITSPNIPDDLDILQFDADVGRNSEFCERIAEDFGQTMTPVGDDLKHVSWTVPEDTAFAGFIWGNGTHFNSDRPFGDYWGILGEMQRINRQEIAVHGPNGNIVAEFEGIGGEDHVPYVLPPEAFCLKRHTWWKEAYEWH